MCCGVFCWIWMEKSCVRQSESMLSLWSPLRITKHTHKIKRNKKVLQHLQLKGFIAPTKVFSLPSPLCQNPHSHNYYGSYSYSTFSYHLPCRKHFTAGVKGGKKATGPLGREEVRLVQCSIPSYCSKLHQGIPSSQHPWQTLHLIFQ